MLRLFLLSFVLLAGPTYGSEPLKHDTAVNLTVLTDDRLLVVLAPLARAYSTETGTPLTIVLKDTTQAEKQIEQGLEAHVLITANYPLIERLSEQGLTDVASRRSVARTQLALVGGPGLGTQGRIAKRISFAAMVYATPNVPIIASGPETADGERVAKLREGYDFSAALNERLQLKSDHEDVVESLRDNDTLGLMFATDAVAEPDLKVLALLSGDVSQPVTYDAIVLGSESMAAANEFVGFLSSPAALKILAHAGFHSPR